MIKNDHSLRGWVRLSGLSDLNVFINRVITFSLSAILLSSLTRRMGLGANSQYKAWYRRATGIVPFSRPVFMKFIKGLVNTR